MKYSGFKVIKEALTGHRGWGPAWRSPEPSSEYDYIIIGGGGHGLATAYYLAKEFKQSRIAVLEKGWIGGGNVGRNTTIIRSNYLLDGNEPFYEFSLKLWEGLEKELNYNAMVSQRGILNLIHSDAQRDSFVRRGNAMLLNGADADLLSKEQIQKRYPFLNTDNARFPVKGGLAQHRGGTVRHDAVAWGYARAADSCGVDIIQNCEVTGFKIEKGVCVGVETTKGFIKAKTVGACVAGSSSRLMQMAGMRLPIESHVLQAFVSEGLKPLLPGVITFGAGHFYCSQSDKGGLVFGGDIDGYNSYAQRGNLPVVEDVCEGGMAIFPMLGRVRLLRMWGGIMDMSMDGSPIIDKTDISGLYFNGGWCYELFMPIFISLIAPGFVDDPEKIELAIVLTRITFPFLMFVCLASFFSAILNSHNKFAAASAAPIILNLVLIAILSFSKTLNDQLVYYLSYGVSIAGLLQIIFLYKFVSNFYSVEFNFKFKITNQVKFFFKKLLPSIFSSGVTQINILVGTIIASFQASAVSYLYYADRIYQINLAIAGIAIGVVILPQLSKYVQLKKKNKILLVQNKALELSIFLSLPATLALLIGSEEIISALFGYGSFDKTAVKNSSLALYYFSFGLPAFAFIKVFSSFFFANHNTTLPFYISFISVLLNIIISIYYFKDIGFVIIPIATSISSWFNAIILFIYLKKENLFYFEKDFLFKFLKIIFASLLMCLFFKYLISNYESLLTYSYNLKIFYLILFVILAFIFYLLVSIFIKAFNYQDLKLK